MNSVILRIQRHLERSQEACYEEQKARLKIPSSGFAGALRELSIGVQNICMECQPLYKKFCEIILRSPHVTDFSHLEDSKGFKRHYFFLDYRYLFTKYKAQFPRLRQSELVQKAIKDAKSRH